MGHYASEMDPSWGERSPAQQRIDELEDENTKEIALRLFVGFNTRSYAGISNAEYAARAAEAIDELVQQRVGQVLKDVYGIVPVEPQHEGQDQAG